MSRCKACNIKLFPQEITDIKNDGMCNRCIGESLREYNYINDHQYEHDDIEDGVLQPKSCDY